MRFFNIITFKYVLKIICIIIKYTFYFTVKRKKMYDLCEAFVLCVDEISVKIVFS